MRPGVPTWLLTGVVMVAFAANSWLCRAALGPGLVDATTFTTARLLAGAAMLAALVSLRRHTRASALGGYAPTRPDGIAALALFVYALAFSLAYVRIPTGVGALLLFGAVQVTMFGWATVTGRSPRGGEWLGLAISMGGLVVLTRPGLEAPDAMGSLLMLASGAAWGVYSLRGRGLGEPLTANATSFAWATLPAAGASVAALLSGQAFADPRGIALAVTSGGVTSALGYALWYTVLPRLTAGQAGIVQLSVPPLVAAGGVGLLGEAVTPRLVVATLAVLGGILVAMTSRPSR
ncbi:MAG: DMT family transporter [Acidobacteria bacterium]|nr:DMT family transporter [Acidobacteriota bacterium]